mmetsp:Transcript_60764/g.161427  ORF Transcript_60764/g.161427 Transcript_60764/m.161427 type:complete len:418 (-) Transcript_60764:98-1351(-)
MTFPMSSGFMAVSSSSTMDLLTCSILMLLPFKKISTPWLRFASRHVAIFFFADGLLCASSPVSSFFFWKKLVVSAVMSSLIFLIFGGTTDGASPFSTSASATILSTMSANIEVANLLPMMFDQWNFLGCNSSGGFCPFTASGASLLFPLPFPLPSLPFAGGPSLPLPGAGGPPFASFPLPGIGGPSLPGGSLPLPGIAGPLLEGAGSSVVSSPPFPGIGGPLDLPLAGAGAAAGSSGASDPGSGGPFDFPLLGAAAGGGVASGAGGTSPCPGMGGGAAFPFLPFPFDDAAAGSPVASGLSEVSGISCIGSSFFVDADTVLFSISANIAWMSPIEVAPLDGRTMEVALDRPASAGGDPDDALCFGAGSTVGVSAFAVSTVSVSAFAISAFAVSAFAISAFAVSNSSFSREISSQCSPN